MSFLLGVQLGNRVVPQAHYQQRRYAEECGTSLTEDLADVEVAVAAEVLAAVADVEVDAEGRSSRKRR